MNSRISLQSFQGLLFVPIFSTLLLGISGKALAIDIKDTNYKIPSDAYFVAPYAPSTNSGTSPDSPMPLAKAIDSAPSGSTIVLRGGTYRNFSADIRKKLTLQAYPNEKPWLKGSVIVSDWVADGGIWRKDNWHHSFPQNVRDEYMRAEYPLAALRDMVYVNGVALKQVASKAEVEPGTFYVNANSNKLYIGSNPHDKTVEATALETGLDVRDAGIGTEIRGIGVAHYAETGLKTLVRDVTFENNTIVWNGTAGIYVGGTDGVVRGNTISYNGRKGVGIYLAHRMLLENNTVSYNNIENFAKSWDAAAVKAVDSDNTVWRNNIVENNFSQGLWQDVGIVDAKIVHNTVRNNEGIGIHFEISHRGIIAGNLVYDNDHTGIMVSDSSSVHVYNNTLSKNVRGIVIKDSKRTNTNSKEIAVGITWETYGTVLKNNILSQATGKTLLEASDCANKQQSYEMISAINNNGYYRRSTNDPETLIKWSWGKDDCSFDYANLASFKSATGKESNGISIDNDDSNPFFVSEANKDFRLKSDSPAIGRGQPLPTNVANALGMAAGVPVDLGAIQSRIVQ